MKKRGTGIGCMWYGIGNTGVPNPASAFVEWLDDGTANLLVGCADIGQGSDTALAQIVAEELGIGAEQVTVTSADTLVTPEGGATSASRQTYISGNAAVIAAREAKKVAAEEAAALLKCDGEIAFVKGFVHVDGQPTTMTVKDVLGSCRMKGRLTLGHGWFNPDTTGLDMKTGQGSPYATYAFAAQVAEVEVDTATGKVEVLRVVAAHDVGRAINPLLVEGQIQGGSLMGVGYALLEEINTDNGNIKNRNFADYLLPTALDVPEIYPIIIEDLEPSGPFGAKGVGEPALIPTAAAIANAVYDAIGVRIYSLPITPEKIMAALSEQAEAAIRGGDGQREG